jgi:hypothetical protein
VSDEQDEPATRVRAPEPVRRDERDAPPPAPPSQPEGEIAGPKGPEPTRYGDWEKNGRCSDF